MFPIATFVVVTTKVATTTKVLTKHLVFGIRLCRKTKVLGLLQQMLLPNNTRVDRSRPDATPTTVVAQQCKQLFYEN